MTCEEAFADIKPHHPNQRPTNNSDIVKGRLEYINEGENIWQAQKIGKIPHKYRLKVKSLHMSNIYRRIHSKQPSYTVTGSGGGGTHMYHWSENRALTNRERARLQTFPNTYEFKGSKDPVNPYPPTFPLISQLDPERKSLNFHETPSLTSGISK